MKIPTAQLEPAFLGILPDKAAEEQNSTSKETARIWITVMQVKELWLRISKDVKILLQSQDLSPFLQRVGNSTLKIRWDYQRCRKMFEYFLLMSVSLKGLTKISIYPVYSYMGLNSVMVSKSYLITEEKSNSRAVQFLFILITTNSIVKR